MQCEKREVRPLYICFALTFLHRKNSPDDLDQFLNLELSYMGPKALTHDEINPHGVETLETWQDSLSQTGNALYERATVSKQI